MLDFGFSLFFLLCLIWISKMEKIDAGTVDEDIVTAADYTICLPTLPAGIDADEMKPALKEHFEKYLPGHRQVGKMDINRASQDKAESAKNAVAVAEGVAAKAHETEDAAKKTADTAKETADAAKEKLDKADKESDERKTLEAEYKKLEAERKKLGTQYEKLVVAAKAADDALEAAEEAAKNHLATAEEGDEVTADQLCRVRNIAFGFYNSAVIDLLAKRGTSIRFMEKVQERLYLNKTIGNEKKVLKNEKVMRKYNKRVDKYEKRLEKMEESGKYVDNPVSAFVTFEREEGFLRAVDAYPNGICYYLCMKKKLKLESKGKYHRLDIDQAKEATDILWENLDKTANSRRLRTCAVCCTALILIVVGTIFVVAAKVSKNAEFKMFPKIDCPSFEEVMSDKQGQFFGNYTANFTSPRVAAEHAKYNTTGFTRAFVEQMGNYSFLDSGNYINSKEQVNVVGCFCEKGFSTNPVQVLDRMPPYQDFNYSRMYANGFDRDKLCFGYGAANPAFIDGMFGGYEQWKAPTGATYTGGDGEPQTVEYKPTCPTTKGWCDDYVKRQLFIQTWNVISIVAVTVVNTVLKKAMIVMTVFQRYPSRTQYEQSIFLKVFIVQFINIGLVNVLVNANLELLQRGDSSFGKLVGGFQDLFSLNVPSFRMLNGDYRDLDVKWYKDVGSTFVMTVGLNSAIPVFTPLLFMILGYLKRCMNRGCSRNLRKSKSETQADLEKLYVGPPFNLALAYSSTVTYITITLFLCSGMPVLVPIMAILLFCRFWLDKLYLFKYHRTPLMYVQSSGAVQLVLRDCH